MVSVLGVVSGMQIVISRRSRRATWRGNERQQSATMLLLDSSEQTNNLFMKMKVQIFVRILE